MSIIQVLAQIPAGTCMYPSRCRYLPRMRVPMAWVGSSIHGMDVAMDDGYGLLAMGYLCSWIRMYPGMQS